METSSKTQLGITGKEGTVFQETIDGVQYAQKYLNLKKQFLGLNVKQNFKNWRLV